MIVCLGSVSRASTSLRTAYAMSKSHCTCPYRTTGCTPVAHGRVPKIGKTFSSSAELHFHHHTPSHTPYRSLPVLSISISICFPTPHLRSARLSPQQNRDFWLPTLCTTYNGRERIPKRRQKSLKRYTDNDGRRGTDIAPTARPDPDGTIYPCPFGRISSSHPLCNQTIIRRTDNLTCQQHPAPSVLLARPVGAVCLDMSIGRCNFLRARRGCPPRRRRRRTIPFPSSSSTTTTSTTTNPSHSLYDSRFTPSAALTTYHSHGLPRCGGAVRVRSDGFGPGRELAAPRTCA